MTIRVNHGRATAVLAAFAALACVPLAGMAGLSLNWTPSVPPGLYWSLHRPARIGELTLVCPPDTAIFRTARERGYLDKGSCPGDYSPLIKRILAAKGDHVRIDREGVVVNGRLLPGSAPRVLDGKRRPLPQLRFDRRLRDGEALPMTSYPNSFDARYIGPVATQRLGSAVTPVWTW